MKQIGVIALIAIVISVLGISTAAAYVDVHGTVLQPDGSTPAGEGVMVTLSCDRNGTMTTKMSQTDSQSEYVVEFNDSECALGDTVTAAVEGDDASTLVMSKDLVLQDLYLLNLELSVPEFSVIAAGVAFAGAGVGYMFMRKRR